MATDGPYTQLCMSLLWLPRPPTFISRRLELSHPTLNVYPDYSFNYHWLKVKAELSVAFHRKPVSGLRSVTCHMGSHSVTCHPTQVGVSCLNPSQADRYSSYLYPKGWKAELTWAIGYILRWCACPKTVTHPCTTRAGRRATTLMGENVCVNR